MIEDYYKLNFYLSQKRHYSVSDLDEMIPFEREIIVSQISREIREKQMKKQQSQMGSMAYPTR